MTDDTRNAALDALIAGDTDLYDVQRRGEYVPPMRTASARIKGDKDRETPVERPQPSEDYLLGIAEGTAMAAPQDHWTVVAAIRAARALIDSGNTLALVAQTIGGTAGRDAGLCAAIAHWNADRDKWARALQIIELEGADPEVGAGIAYRPLETTHDR